MEKILIIHPNGMGDFIMFTPALNLLKKNFPNAKIDILITNKNIKQFIEAQNIFNNVFVSDLNLKNLIKIAFKLRKKYDLSFFTIGNKIWKTKIFSFLLNNKYMIGESKNLSNKYPFDKVIIRDDYAHLVDKNIELVQLIVKNKEIEDRSPRIKVKELSLIKTEKFLKDKGIENLKLFGVHPGSQKAFASRRWPEEYFAEVINNIDGKNLIKCLVFIGPEDQNIRDYLKERTNAIFIENWDIDDTIAMISKCSYFFNSDSGLGHIFTCFNKKIFSIFGPNQLGENQELRTGPYSDERVILKIENMPKEYYLELTERGIFRCLVDLKPEVVIERIEKELNK
ncbi:glycosyltransferase family 9 protein [Fusobacterium periodonticum]|jgi:ADP-heptose:LPS heptosyltransferase|uniref:Lipopolysaccharide heptosyltransferase family protein n=2 Tax=Fusobacterium periodonticum TaxID=860 RepID=A0AAD0HSR2_9FUSO|nr:glycosyltransferase family 9 protein [Fusobacterium periodonticum]AVQ24297.1 lipopolysaccharide heptosyltransferase family protein [Fusobacterium periodonticum]KGE62619.1 hypothetical protein FSAG_001241 [Fusobacterium periodonticum 2_1_31]